MKVFEQNIVNQLLKNSELSGFDLTLDSKEVIEFSGAGYFVKIKNSLLPIERVVLNKPNISGKLGGIKVGYLCFIENSELMLECYSYDKEVLPKHRDQSFVQN